MPGLPHFLNAKASTKYYEPFYQNLFEVTILPPNTVAGGSILLEHVNKISGLTQDRGSEVIEQKYKFAKRSYAKGDPTDTINDIEVEFSLNLNDANELYVYKTLRNWQRLIYNPLTGEQGLKKDYVGTIIVTFHDCFPTGDMPDYGGDYGSGDAQVLAVKWRSDWWEENIV
jgi:hypothetical protein